VRSPTTGAASSSNTASAGTPYRRGCAQRRSPQRANRGARGSPARAHGSDRRVTFGPSLASTAGSSVSAAASTNTTDSITPSAIERKAGLGTSITALSATSTVTPENSTALPAVSIAVAAASAGDSRDPNSAARKRTTMNSA